MRDRAAQRVAAERGRVARQAAEVVFIERCLRFLKPGGLLAIVVPVSALVSCTIGVSALVWAGVIPPASALFNAWSWWAGDTLGALVATPLMFAFFGRPASAGCSRMIAN